jgi:hypothetical protein
MSRRQIRSGRTPGARVKMAFAAAVLAYCAAFMSFDTTVRADSPPPTAQEIGRPLPTPQQIGFAQRTSHLMLATLLAALSKEFEETTADNVEEGKKSISLIFHDSNDDMRLVGTLDPLRANDVPQDAFETAALNLAMLGGTIGALDTVRGKWVYRQSVPLSNFHAACGMCHKNYGPVDDTQFVGALMVRIPITD